MGGDRVYLKTMAGKTYPIKCDLETETVNAFQQKASDATGQ